MTRPGVTIYLHHRFQHDIHVQSLLLYKPGSQTPAWLEARRWGRKMGRKGSGCACEKAEEEKGCYGGPGESPELSWAAQQVCYNSEISGWSAAGFPQERASACYLLQSVALARPSVPPWAQAIGSLRISIWLQTEGGLHQPISLQASGKSW